MWQLKKLWGGGEQRERMKSGKSGAPAEIHALGRARATIRLVSEQKTLKLWKKAWSNEKTSREPHAICPKLTYKTLKIHKGLCKAASALVV